MNKYEEELKRLRKKDFVEFGIPAIFVVILYALFFIFADKIL